MKERLESSVFVHGSCATSRSYHFDQHGEATLLRPSTLGIPSVGSDLASGPTGVSRHDHRRTGRP